MPARARHIARVRLARSIPRLFAAPLALILAAAALISVGLLIVGGVAAIGMVVLGGALAALGVGLAAIPMSVRVHVEESLVRVTWLFGRRVYLLTPGSLTRVHLRGPEASTLRARFGVGWALGPAVLRGEEEIHVVRLAPTESAIVVPTAQGRLAIATSNEPHLIDSLMRAARARAERQEQEAADAAIAASATEPAASAMHTALAPSLAAGLVSEGDPDLMTGIERALYEQRLAQQRAATAAADPVAAPATAAPTAASSAAPVPRVERRPWLRRPSWASRRPSMPSMPSLPSMSVPSVSMPSVSIPSVSMPSVSMPALPAMPERVRGIPIRRPKPSWLLPLVPLAGAGVAWGIGVWFGRMPAAGTDAARLTALALVLAGPATTVGAVMARTWWPRIVGVVIVGGLASAVLVARSLAPL